MFTLKNPLMLWLTLVRRVPAPFKPVVVVLGIVFFLGRFLLRRRMRSNR